jgi:signal transduction histidine kinase
VPLAPRIQREAFRITREAITNAIKHADATIIKVQLQYPTEVSASVKLIICDNGHNAQSVARRNGHRGVPLMEESARAAGGMLTIHVEPGQATTVGFAFPATATPNWTT